MASLARYKPASRLCAIHLTTDLSSNYSHQRVVCLLEWDGVYRVLIIVIHFQWLAGRGEVQCTPMCTTNMYLVGSDQQIDGLYMAAVIIHAQSCI